MMLASSTLAHIHLDGEIDEVFASTEEALRGRIVEAIRLLAASAGEPVTATVVDGAVRWPLIVHPDGSFIEATALAETEDGEPASAPRALRTGEVPVLDAADAPSTEAEVAPAAAPVPAPAVEVAAEVAAPSPAESGEVPAAAAPVAASAPDVPVFESAPAEASVPRESAPEASAPAGPLRSTTARREPTLRDPVQRVTPTVEDLLGSRADRVKPRATEGWQGAIRRATGGAGLAARRRAEQSRLDRERVVQRRLDGPRTIVVLNPKGGAHKTTSTLLLAATFGTQRGGTTWPGTTAKPRRPGLARAERAAPPHRRRPARAPGFVRRAEPGEPRRPRHRASRRSTPEFDVLASDRRRRGVVVDRRGRVRPPARRAVAKYRLLIVDTGNNMRASNWVAAVAAADQLVIVSTVREDTAASAAWLLDGLREGADRKIDDAVTILSLARRPSPTASSPSASVSASRRSRATSCTCPSTPRSSTAGPIDFDASRPSRDAWLSVAASLSASDPRGRAGCVRPSGARLSVGRVCVRPSVPRASARQAALSIPARCAFFDSACRFQQRALGCVLQIKRGGSGRAQDASVREHPNACAHPNACGSQESPPGRAVDSCARCAFFDSAHRFQQRAQESAAHPRLSSARRVQ
ncbi:MAG: chromosome partitioning protein [Microbacterium sp.]